MNSERNVALAISQRELRHHAEVHRFQPSKAPKKVYHALGGCAALKLVKQTGLLRPNELGHCTDCDCERTLNDLNSPNAVLGVNDKLDSNY